MRNPKIGHNNRDFYGELYTIFLQIPSNNFFSKRGFLFHKGNFFSQTARYSLTHEPWKLRFL